MSELAMALGLILFLVCFVLVAVHSCRLGRLTLLDWAILGMGGLYGLGWVIVTWVTLQQGNPDWEEWLRPFDSLYPIHTIATLVLLAGIWLGWLLAKCYLPLRQPIRSMQDRRTNGRIEQAAWTMFVLAFFMQWLYSHAYGGFIEILEYSSLIRSAIFIVNNELSFLEPFGALALFASFGFWGLWLSGRRKASTIIGLLLSTFFSFYLLYSWLGRIGFLVYLSTFILGALFFRQSRPLQFLLIGGALGMGILIGAYYISIFLGLNTAGGLSQFLARELSFPFASFFAQLDAGEHLFRSFKDIVAVPLFLLPSSLWSTWIDEVSQVNTALILGAPKGEGGVTGGIPVDLLTLGLMQAHMFGVPFVGGIFGIFLRIIQNLIDRIPNAGVSTVFGVYAAFKIAVLGVFYSQPALVVKENFAFLIAGLIIALFLNTSGFRLSRKRSRMTPTESIFNQK